MALTISPSLTFCLWIFGRPGFLEVSLLMVSSGNCHFSKFFVVVNILLGRSFLSLL